MAASDEGATTAASADDRTTFPTLARALLLLLVAWSALLSLSSATMPLRLELEQRMVERLVRAADDGNRDAAQVLESSDARRLHFGVSKAYQAYAVLFGATLMVLTFL